MVTLPDQYKSGFVNILVLEEFIDNQKNYLTGERARESRRSKENKEKDQR